MATEEEEMFGPVVDGERVGARVADDGEVVATNAIHREDVLRVWPW